MENSPPGTQTIPSGAGPGGSEERGSVGWKFSFVVCRLEELFDDESDFS